MKLGGNLMATPVLGRASGAWCALVVALSLACVPAGAQQVPVAPGAVAVTVSPTATALMVMDLTQQPCGVQAACVAFVPHVAAMIAAARKSGALVVYSSNGGISAPVTSPSFLPAIAPQSGDPIIFGAGQDRFYSTPLDGLLRQHGITTIIMAGWRENGSILYTAVGANLRNYTVVVPVDGTSASTDADIAIGAYQLLTQLNANPKNEPLHKGAVTLSRSDLITYR
jgi:nicotinamidase-related amidase